MNKRKVLFLCTGNSARSLFGEFILRKKDPIRFETFSAGANPKDGPHPFTLQVLREQFHINADDARSKSWEEFSDVHFDFVITVCDNARETCPVWPGQPIVAHWGSPDPAQASGSEEERLRVFKDVAWQISRRIDLLLNLPVEKLEKFRLQIEEGTKAIGGREHL